MARRRIPKHQLVYALLFAGMVIGLWWLEQRLAPDPFPPAPGEETTGFPEEYLPQFSEAQPVRHAHYLLGYAEPYEQAAWVAYTLKAGHLTGQDRERPYFERDPRVPSGSAHWRNYKGSGYDRGHLCPAGDRRFSETAYNQTFYTSNISPQDPRFNAGIWNDLEQQVRRWARRYGEVHVITGGVLRPGLPTIGEEGVAVPEAFYKVVFRGTGPGLRAVGFLIPHAPSAAGLRGFEVPLDRIEAETGLDFFPALPPEVEAALEGHPDPRGWPY